MTKPPAAIFDMDGTLVDVSGIRYLLVPDDPRNPSGKKDFDAFHAASIDAPAHQWVVDELWSLQKRGVDIFIVTARADVWATLCLIWLREHDVSDFVELLMRPYGDWRPDTEIKKELLAIIRRTHEPIVAYDDNPKVIDLWRSEGIHTVVVPGWD